MYWFGCGFSLVVIYKDQQAIGVALYNLNVSKMGQLKCSFFFLEVN